MANNDEMKPCPFCGGEPQIKLWSSEGRRDSYFLIRCTCGARMSNFRESAEQAISDWNRRDGNGEYCN